MKERDEQILNKIKNYTGLPCMFDDKHNLIVAFSDYFQAYYDHMPQDNNDYTVLIHPEHHYISKEEMEELLNYVYMKTDLVYSAIVEAYQ